MAMKYGIVLRKKEKEADVGKAVSVFRYEGFTTCLEILNLAILF